MRSPDVHVEISSSGALRIEVTAEAASGINARDVWAAFDEMNEHGESFLRAIVGPRPTGEAG